MKNIKSYFVIFFIILILLSILSINSLYINKNTNVYEMYKDLKIISYYNSPVVPEGFKKVDTETASWKTENNIIKGWNNGLVIEDQKGNQFVWVPVNFSLDNLKEYKKKDDFIITNTGEILTEKELLQLLKYQGFYISRYEAGISDELMHNTTNFSTFTNNIKGIPVSKKGQIVWNFISWNNAKNNAINMYNNNSIKSDLITFNEWGYTVNWISQENINISNSFKYGNYSNSYFSFSGLYSCDNGNTYQKNENTRKQDKNIILATGISEEHCVKNIYDMAGNICEYVDIIYSINKNNTIDEFYSCMGGYYDNIGNYSISNSMSISSPNSNQGFRIVLYQ